MYNKNKLSRKAVKYRTWKFFRKIRKYIFGLAGRRVGVTKKGAFTRNRKLSYLSVFLTILDVGRETLQIKLCRLLPKMKCEECSQQAFSKARGNMDHTAFKELFDFLVENANNDPDMCTTEEIPGYLVLAIDGSKVALPNLPEFREKYFTTGSGATSPTALISTVVSVTDGRIVDAVWSEKCDERKCARHHMDVLDKYFGDGKTVVMLLMDRGYPSDEFLKDIVDRKFAFCLRCKNRMNSELAALPEVYDGEYTFPSGVKVRCVRFPLDSGETETLVTSDWNMSVEELKRLYFRRWASEKEYLTIKNRLELENFTGKTENSVLQDFWATMCADQLLWLCEFEVNPLIADDRVDKDNKYQYKMNRSMFVATMKDKLIETIYCPYERKQKLLYNKMLDDARKHVIPIKPGRKTPRAKNKRKTEYSFNNKHNC